MKWVVAALIFFLAAIGGGRANAWASAQGAVTRPGGSPLHLPNITTLPSVSATTQAASAPATEPDETKPSTDPIALILILLFMVTAVSIVATRINIPYPTAMVLAGLLIGVAGLVIPRFGALAIRLSPAVLFQLILPPLLYAAAWSTSWRDFRFNLRPIVLLATGGVVFTTLGVAVLAMAWFPGFTWPAAFALGAIVSPPDAIAATAVTERLRIPKRLIAVLDGESLVNDATALVVLRFALAAALLGSFSVPTALGQFVIVAGGGVLGGLAVAGLFHMVHTRIEHATLETAMTLLAPYASYQLAEHLGVSGVLATVTCGLVLSRHSHHLFSARTRLTAIALWDFLTFLLNGLAFVMIGLQLPAILRTLHGSVWQNVAYAATTCVAVVALRILWIFPGAYLPRLIPSLRRADPMPPWQHIFFIGWVGMRGVVSLAAALALPVALNNGEPFPGRNMILFLTFAVILFTLVGQSLTLPAVIRLLRLESADDDICHEAEARRRTIKAAIGALDKEQDSALVRHLRDHFAFRMRNLDDCREEAKTPGERPTAANLRSHPARAAIVAQREALLALRDAGQIPDSLLRKLEHELDLEESGW